MAEKVEKPGPTARLAGLGKNLQTFVRTNRKLVVAVTSASVVLAVLIVTNHLRQTVRRERTLAELFEGVSTERIEEIRDQNKDVPDVHALALYLLGARYYEESARGPEVEVEFLRKAKETYEEFLKWYGDRHTLGSQARKALEAIRSDLEFLQNDKGALLAQYSLCAHPRLRTISGSGKSPWGPILQTARIELRADRTVMQFRLSIDEAPEACRRVVRDLEEGKWRDAEVTVEGGEKIRIRGKEIQGELAFEISSIPWRRGAIALVREGDKNRADTLEICLKEPASPAERTVIGVVEKEEVLNLIRGGERIGDSRVLSKPD